MSEITQSPELIIFSSDGIRGIDGQWPLNEDGISRIGKVLSQFVLKNKPRNPLVVLGRDTRPLGKKHVQILKECLGKAGIKVEDLGIAPTPVIAYITKKRSAKLGIAITASHNPSQYNGIKLIGSNGLRLQPKAEKWIEKSLGKSTDLPKILKDENKDVIAEYIQDHVHLLHNDSLLGLRLVIDCANGSVSQTGARLLTGLGAIVVKSYNNDLTGKKLINKNCGSEYYREHPKKLINLVIKNNADYGFSFDGDGDRIVVVDKAGNFYNGDDLLYALATHFRRDGLLQDNKVVITENSNTKLKEELRCFRADNKKLGIKTIIAQNGDKHLEAKIWSKGKLDKEKYGLGGEQVGNIIIRDGEHGSADSLYAISLIFKHLIEKDVTLAAKTHSLKNKYHQVSASIHMSEKAPKKQITQMRDEWEKKYGVRITPWYSSTESGLFTVVVEGTKYKRMKTISNLALQFCENVLRMAQEKPKVVDLSSRKRTRT